MIGQVIVLSVLGLSLMLLGYLVKNRKHYNMIAGYNTMSEQEKAKVDIAGLAGYMKTIFVAMGLIIIAAALLDFMIGPQTLAPVIAGITLLAGTSILLANSKKFLK